MQQSGNLCGQPPTDANTAHIQEQPRLAQFSIHTPTPAALNTVSIGQILPVPTAMAPPAPTLPSPYQMMSPLRFAPPPNSLLPLPTAAHVQVAPPRKQRRIRKAPFMQVIDEMRASGVTADEKMVIDTYPELMKAYEDDIKSVYTAAEESCSRIIANTLLPDLSDATTESNMDDPLPHAVKNAFFHAINEMQTTGIPRTQRGALPKAAVDKFKQWFEINSDFPYPSDEVKVALSNETGIDIMQISNWFTNHRKRVWKSPHQQLISDDHFTS